MVGSPSKDDSPRCELALGGVGSGEFSKGLGGVDPAYGFYFLWEYVPGECAERECPFFLDDYPLWPGPSEA